DSVRGAGPGGRRGPGRRRGRGCGRAAVPARQHRRDRAPHGVTRRFRPATSRRHLAPPPRADLGLVVVNVWVMSDLSHTATPRSAREGGIGAERSGSARMAGVELVGLSGVRAAARRIRGRVVRTPLLPSPWPGLWLKPENLQPTGAFKLRGATYALARVPATRRAAGVVTHSSGNHGLACAYAARAAGVPCTVVVPDAAAPHKVAAIRDLGAEVVPVPAEEREARARRIADERGATVVPPYDHRDVIAGQGTVGLEIVADLPDVDTVLVPVGGGGLASGVAA